MTDLNDPIATAPTLEAKLIEMILGTHRIDDDVFGRVRGHATDPANWELAGGALLYRRGPVGLHVTPVNRWDGDFLRYSRTPDTRTQVLLDYPTDFGDPATLASDVIDGLAVLDA